VVRDVNPGNLQRDSGYGYQWWVPDQDGGKATIFAGNGYGGQYLLVVPEYDLVAVFNGWNIHGGGRRAYWGTLQERIIPAIG
jgi:CubicO group peptidase (beta-lactamase class C family)